MLVDIWLGTGSAVAASTGMDAVWQRMINMVESVDATLLAIEKTLPSNFPERVWQTINVGTRNQAQQFMRELNAAKLP